MSGGGEGEGADRVRYSTSAGKKPFCVDVGGTRILDYQSTDRIFQCLCPDHQGWKPCAIDAEGLSAGGSKGIRHHHKVKILAGDMQRQGQLILDAGCREGPIVHVLAEKNHVVGLDVCPGQVLGGEESVLNKGYEEVVFADVCGTPFVSEQFDLIVATDLLEHLTVPEDAVVEMRRLLKPGGELLVAVPNLVSYGNRLSILLGSGKGMELHGPLKGRSIWNPIDGLRYPDQRQHLRFFTGSSLVRLLEGLGLRVLGRRGYDPLFSRIPFGELVLRSLCSLVVVRARRE